MSMTVDGVFEVKSAFEHLRDNLGDMVAKAVIKGANRVRTTAVKSIQRHQSQGIAYEKTNPKRTHVASTAGHAPNSDTGTLVNSIQTEPNTMAKSMLVGTKLQYGKDLELGTRNIRPRPWLIPALESNRADVENDIKQAIKRATAI
jgi:HK97 gp10 family phage protein